ncbi:hypothetical protein KL927_002544 [Ogataea polymorpha]|nr:hypothetical protein KL927_002544 [Ogataea polymorpha]
MNDSSLSEDDKRDRSELKVQLISYDSYQSEPSSLDKQRFTLNNKPYSGNSTVFNQVPVIRVYGKLTTGHTCLLHIHNVFPYLYVQYRGPTSDEKKINDHLLSWKNEIDTQIYRSFKFRHRKKPKPATKEDETIDIEGVDDVNDDDDDGLDEEEVDIGAGNTYVADISLVKGNSFYGYHFGFSPFIKISLLSPRYVKRLERLLGEGRLFGKVVQPFEAHIPYMLQFLTDYNCFGCNWISLEKAFWRSPLVQTQGPLDAFQEYFETDFAQLNQIKVTSEVKQEIARHLTRDMFSVNVLSSEKYPRMGRVFCELDTSAVWLKNRLTCKERDVHSKLSFNIPEDQDGDSYIYSIKSLLSDLEYQRRLRNMSSQAKVKLFSGGKRDFAGTTWIEQDELDELLAYCVEESKKEWSRLHPKHPLEPDTVVPRNDWLQKYNTSFQSVDEFHCPRVPESHLLRVPEELILHESQICDWLLERDTEPQMASTQDVSTVDVVDDASDPSSDETEHEDDFLGSIPHIQEKLGIKTGESPAPAAPDETNTDEAKSSGSINLDLRIFEQTQASRRHSDETNTSIEPKHDTQIDNPAIKLTASEELFELTRPPPTFPNFDAMGKSFEDHALLKIEYPDPYYSSRNGYSDAPEYFAGRKFQVKCLDLQGLKPYAVATNANSNSVSIAGDGVPSIWSYRKHPPLYEDVLRWSVEHPDPIKTRSQLLRSQIDQATQNMKGYKVPSFQSPIVRKANNFNKLIVLNMELHVNTRGDLFPDPLEDEIRMIFWSFDDQNYPIDLGIEGSGVFVVHSHEVTRKHINFPVQTFSSEVDMVRELVSLVELVDPDILSGYEIHSASWGYLLERFRQVHKMDLAVRLSRVAAKQLNKMNDRWGFTHASGIKITGRHMLNLWRPLRKELSINRYSLENVVWHTLHIKIPHYEHKTLTQWFLSNNPGNLNNLVEYYMSRLHWQMKLINKMEIIERMVEESRFLGIDYYSVFYRGSQFKVESLLVRLAKAENFILISPSKKQVFKQDPLQVIPLILEPESSFYKSPLLVLDFQSLYPSLVIAHNLCYSTLLGRLQGYDPKKTQTIGITSWKLPPGLLKLFEKHITVTPNGLMFLNPNVRKSLLAKMLSEILDARILVKDTMNGLKDDSELYKLYNNRQLALKLIANVTYGYASATYSGRMPNSAIADAIVSAARQTLHSAISEIDKNEKWGAKVVYGDTDSLFVYLPGKSKADAFKLGREISNHITSLNPSPVRLKFEKVYFPCVLISKKRYAGYSYEHEDQETPKFDAKGIETVRRDGVPAQQKMVEKSLRLLFETKDLTKVKQYVNLQFLKIMQNKANLQDFLFAKEIRLGTYKNPTSIPPGARITMKKVAQDHRSEPQYRERVFYMVAKGYKDQLLRDRCMAPRDFLANGNLELDAFYYITKVLIPPLQRIFNLCGVDVNKWFDELPRNLIAPNLDQLNFKTPLINSAKCISCNTVIQRTLERTGKLCPECSTNELQTIAHMRSCVRAKESQMDATMLICKQCTKRSLRNNNSPLSTALACTNEDCSVFYDRIKAITQTEKTMAAYAEYLSW